MPTTHVTSDEETAFLVDFNKAIENPDGPEMRMFTDFLKEQTPWISTMNPEVLTPYQLDRLKARYAAEHRASKE